MMKAIAKTPTILQMEAAECGAASLAIILAYYGRYVPLVELRKACGISRDGSRAVNLLKAAREYGLKAQGAQVDAWDKVFDLTLPSIIFWEFNHYLVLEGIANDRIYINDPGSGPHVISIEAFKKGFTGVILLFEPGPQFVKSAKPHSLLKEVTTRLRDLKSTMIYIVLVSLFLVIPGLLIPGFIKIFIDDILLNGVHDWFYLVLIGMTITALFQAGFTYIQQIRLVKVQTKLYLHSALQFMWHVLRLPIDFFNHRYAGDIAERISANDRIAEILSKNVSTSIVNLVGVIFYAGMMIILAPILAIISIIIATFNGYLLYYITKKIANTNFQFLQESGKLYGIEMNGLQLIETLKASGAEDAFFKRWAGFYARTINSEQSIDRFDIVLEVVPILSTLITTAIFLSLGSYYVIYGKMTIGSLLAFQVLLLNFNEPLKNLLSIGGELPKIRGNISRLDDVLQNPLDPCLLSTEQKRKTSQSGKLTLQEIRFGYSPLEPPLIDRLSLSIKANEHVAIVGATGSGKSTIAKLMLGLYPIWEGDIRVDDKQLYGMSGEERAAVFAYVDTDVFLIDGTIRDNITLWNPSFNDDVIEQALKEACIFEVVKKHGGLNAKMSERGNNFSGGERQRLEIARAILREPSILILDEATSALDAIVEKTILDHLKKRRSTLIMITHRLSAIRDCDQIIVLDQGRMVQHGTHNELINQEGLYQQLYGRQSKNI